MYCKLIHLLSLPPSHPPFLPPHPPSLPPHPPPSLFSPLLSPSLISSLLLCLSHLPLVLFSFPPSPPHLPFSHDHFTDGIDFSEVSEVVTFEPGQSVAIVTIPLSPDDVFPEPDKVFEVFLGPTDGVYITPYAAANVTILNDDDDLPGRQKVIIHVLLYE